MDEEIIISVNLDTNALVAETAAAVKSLKDLQSEQKALTKQMQEGNELTSEQAARYAELGKQIEDAKTTIKSNTALLQQNAQSTKESTGSLNELRQKLKEAQNAYAAMSQEQRESDLGKTAQQQIEQLHESVLEIEQSIGQSQRNVGNYADALKGFGGTVKSAFTGNISDAAKGVSGFGGSLSGVIPTVKGFAKTLLTTPLGWISAAIAAVVAVFGKLKEAFAKNDAAGTAFSKLFATFQPIIDGVSKALNTVVGWLGQAADAIANFFGGVSDEVAEAQKLVEAMDALQDAEREYVVQSAERTKEIERLKTQSVESDKYSVEQRRDFLRQALDLQEQDLQAQKDIAAEKYRLAKEQAERDQDTSDETKDRLAELEAAKINAEANFYTKKKEIASQLVAFDKQISDADAARTKAAQEQAKARAEAAQREADTTLQLQRQLEDAIIANMLDADAQKQAQTQVQYDREIEDLKKRLDTEKNLTVTQRQILNDLIVQTETAKAQALAALEDERQKKVEDNAKAIYDARMKYGLVTDEEKMQTELDELQAYYEQGLLQLDEFEQAKAEIEASYKPEDEGDDDEYSVEDAARELFGIDQDAIDYYKSLLEEGMDANEAFAKTQKMVAQTNVKSFSQAAGAMAGAFEDMSTMLEEYGSQTKSAQAAQKAFALAGILASQAQSIADGALAISAGIAQSQSVPFPANIAAIATTVATITSLIVSTVSSFVQAKNVLSSAGDAGAYATGGIVGGSSFSGDQLTARVNSGEMILTREQQANLFDMASSQVATGGGINYDRLADAMAAQPAPVMDYTEFQQFGQKVATYNEITKV
jgi:hypothetical protein